MEGVRGRGPTEPLRRPRWSFSVAVEPLSMLNL